MLISSFIPVSSASLPPSSQNRQCFRRACPPISISTNPSHVDILRLRDLLASCGHSCHRFPAHVEEGLTELMDPEKLRIAIHHSFIVVSVFCRSKFLPSAGGGAGGNEFQDENTIVIGFEKILERTFLAPGPDHCLIGFGRAVSDEGLTASLHDVVITPSLQRRGIGRKVIERIIRILTSKGIYDISALCSEKERLFFEACGFGKDPLDSTMMMYTRSNSTEQEGNFVLRTVGRMRLVVPPSVKLYHSKEQCGGK